MKCLNFVDLQKHWLLGRFRIYHEKKRKRSSEPIRLPHYVRFGYSMGHMLNDLCASMWFTYSLVFYTAVIGVSDSVAGLMMIIGQISDALATPIIGALSDRGGTRHPNKTFGKRKKWYLAGTVLVGVSKPFMFSPSWPCKEKGDYCKAGYFSFFIILFQIGWAAVQTVHLAMVADLTPHEDERTFLLSLRNTMTALCNVITYIGQWVTIILWGEDDKQMSTEDVLRFQVLILSVVVLGILCSVIFLILVPEDPLKFRTASDESQSTTSRSLASHNRSLKSIMAKWRLHFIGFIYANVRVFVVSVQALLTLYLHKSLNSAAYQLASVPLVLNVFCFIASLATGPLSELFGHKIVFFSGTIIGVGACVWTYFGQGDFHKYYSIYVIALLFGKAIAFLQVSALALVAEYIGEDINNAAFIYGYMSCLDKVSTGIILALILHFHDEDCKQYFTYAVTISCGVSSILALIAVMFLKLPMKSITPEGSLHLDQKLSA